jgi:hypothetical protein
MSPLTGTTSHGPTHPPIPELDPCDNQNLYVLTSHLLQYNTYYNTILTYFTILSHFMRSVA